MKILFIGNDKNYFKALGDYMRSESSGKTDVDYTVADCLLDSDDIDISCYDICVLDEGAAGPDTAVRLGVDIYKFSTADKLGAYISQAARQGAAEGLTGGKEEKQGKEMDLVSVEVFSSAGGVGVSTVAMGMARELSRYRCRQVLYISTECYVARQFCMETEVADPNVQRLVYLHTRGEVNKWQEALDATLYKDSYGVWRLKYEDGLNPLYSLTGRELTDFIGAVVERSGAEVIVLDRGVCGGSRLRDSKWKNLPVYVLAPTADKQLKEDQLDQLFGKSLVVKNMVDIYDDVGDGADQTKEMIVCRDEYDVRRLGEAVEISLANVFSHGMKTLVDEVIDRLFGDGDEETKK